MKNNKLIAEFMGVPQGKHTHFMVEPFRLESYADVDDLKYDISWSWLMPVGEKIDAMFGEDDEVDDAINRVHNAVLSFDIDNTYRAIVEFIEDYNESNKMDTLPPSVQQE
jgi:hypothetical protein